MPTKLLLLSPDFDGCLFNKDYRTKYKAGDTNNSLIEANTAFIAAVVDKIKKGNFSKVTLIIGSLRQSFEFDTINSFTRSMSTRVTESCFSALQKLSSEFQKYISVPCEVDKYLLADSFGCTPAGENFDKTIQYHEAEKKKETPEKYSFSNFMADKSKLNLIYAQMHRVASQNPDAEITYDFYDDKLDSILVPLKVFFEANPDLIPANLNLQLHSYAGETIKAFDNIKGTGKIDYNYEYNLKKMWVDAELCCATIFTTPPKEQESRFDLAKHLRDKLESFKQTRDTEAPALATSAASSVASATTGPVTSFFANKKATEKLPKPVAPTSFLDKIKKFL